MGVTPAQVINESSSTEDTKVIGKLWVAQSTGVRILCFIP